MIFVEDSSLAKDDVVVARYYDSVDVRVRQVYYPLAFATFDDKWTSTEGLIDRDFDTLFEALRYMR